MWTNGVVIIHELHHDAPQMSSIDEENVIQAFCAVRAHPAFSKRVRVERSDRSVDDLKSFRFENRIKGWAERAILIMDQEA